MNAIDATDRTFRSPDAPPPSLLTIILDTNPHAWAHLEPTLPLQKAIANLLVFINAHLAFNHSNEVAVLASHSQKIQWLYPTPKPPSHNLTRPASPRPNGASNGTHSAHDDANKYRPFRIVEQQILANLSALLASTTSSDLSSTTTTLISGALTTALTYIAKAALAHAPPTDPSASLNVADPSPTFMDANDGTTSRARTTLTSRILVLSVSGDLAAQYIPVMNAIFAAQRQRIPIDILKIAGDTVFLQQACDATGGVYMEAQEPAGLLQYLMMSFLPDATARDFLVLPSGGAVDFRAACFCHEKIVELGWVCSVCLSIFCGPPEHNQCLTCGNQLSMASTLPKPPALIQRKKKKKKRAAGDGASAGVTPSGTPGPA
ncbi:transcription factor Tfb4 [Pseudovirgaria hyperparasitica]|uniref:General transcription and DNA repair factor IIH subunit TFB4 n=1 Tax=Pseudovirgaria hyperparasitica TaxID=470096 RepID=A0A6A6WGI9_9PEZI|nr:transcription factor Tfb4 [Pseudovirgaria hyperparasitica]KAF2761903.1 transcription factor Tfb4 [Pseudovirgaria hyperparasitica]